MLSVVIQSQLSYPAMQLAPQPVHHRLVQPGPLVLRSDLLKLLTPTEDRDRTVSRRSEPSSRTTLIDEQSNPWDLLQPQDVMSRHRGAKPPRRCDIHFVTEWIDYTFILFRMATYYPLPKKQVQGSSLRKRTVLKSLRGNSKIHAWRSGLPTTLRSVIDQHVFQFQV